MELKKKEDEIKEIMKGKIGNGISRKVYFLDRRIIFKKTANNASWQKAFGTLGYLNMNSITKLKVTFRYDKYE